MAYDSFNALVQSIKDVNEDDSQEFADFVPNAIRAAELRLTKDIDTVGLKQNVEVTATAGQRTVSKPVGFRLVHDVFVYDSDTQTEYRLKIMPDDYLRDYWPQPLQTGFPRYVATDYDKNNLLLAPTPDDAYPIRINMMADETPISLSNQTNYFTQYCGEVLFYATMVEIKRFAKDMDGTSFWETAYQSAIKALNNQGRRERRDDGPPPANPSGGQNTLSGDK